jgi:hypothetical protein
MDKFWILGVALLAWTIIGYAFFKYRNKKEHSVYHLLHSIDCKLDKLLEGGGTNDEDAILRQQIFDTLTKIKSDLESTV